MDVVIYHNARCGTSRNVLTIIEAAGYRPHVVEYLKEGWTRGQLLGLFAAASLDARAALRTKGAPPEALELRDADDETILAAMVEDPILVNRPFVCTAKGVRLCRPSEQVLDLLDRWPPGPLVNEDGALIIDAKGRRMG